MFRPGHHNNCSKMNIYMNRNRIVLVGVTDGVIPPSLFIRTTSSGRANQTPPYWSDPYRQGVCVIEADVVAMLTKITEAAASFLLLQSVCVCVCVCVCIVHGLRLFQRRRDPFSRPRCIGPFHRSPLSIFIAAPLSSPISEQLSCERRLAPPIARLLLWEHSHLSPPSPHPLQWLLCFFFTLTQCVEKKKEKKRKRVEKESFVATRGRDPTHPTSHTHTPIAEEKIDRQRLPSEHRQWQPPPIDEGGGGVAMGGGGEGGRG